MVENTSTSASVATADTSTANAADFSFVESMGVDNRTAEAALSLALMPRHDTIGTLAGITTTQVCVTIKARDLPDDDDHIRAPVDIIVALDVSGSMDGDKLKQCKQTLELLLRALLPRDRFGLISFASEARVDIPAQLMTAENKEAALRKIRSLHTRRCTNISAAIGLASQEMSMVDDPNEVRTIFLLTDGHANEGIINAPDIVLATKRRLVEGASFDTDAAMSEDRGRGGFSGMLKKLAAISSSSSIPKNVALTSEPRASPITMHCFGYGSDHDADFLRQIANTTSGSTYYYVENDSNVGAAFGDACGGILSVVAQNAVVTIKVPPEASALGVNIVDVHHLEKIKRDENLHSVTVGDFYAEESRDVIFELTLATPPNKLEDSPIPHAQITLAATDTIQKRPLIIGPATCFIKRPETSEVTKANQHVILQWLRVYATQEMKEAEEMASRGSLSSARAKIEKTLETIPSTPGVNKSDPLIHFLQLIAELQTILRGLSSQQTYSSGGAHYMQRTLQTHTYQRCSEDTHYSSNVYRGSKKAARSAAFS